MSGLAESNVPDDAGYLSATYEQRFSAAELRDKEVLWSTLVEEVFQAYVPREGTVLDLGTRGGALRLLSAANEKSPVPQSLRAVRRACPRG